MLAHGKRPRELRWYHAGPMLFGDWGTSRLYVLGLAFLYTQHAALWFMIAMSALLVAVGWAYQVICRLYPDGGGVYSSARHRSQTLAVVGALLLCADYVVTAALSALDAFHYVQVPAPHIWAAVAIGLIAVMNYFGPTKAGTFALVVALCTIVLTLVIALFALPSVPHATVSEPAGHFGNWWVSFTRLILAISGVEAIANMTGIMVKPVHKTARRAIWPVVTEIVVLNLLLTAAMQAIPLDVLGDGNVANAYSAHADDMLRVLSEYYVGPVFAVGASLVFAMLLLSAVNTALTDLVSIQFMMSRDRELPGVFGGLNRYGMPVAPLVLASLVPLGLVVLIPHVEDLADLYAIGVVGAVAVNLGTCSTNFHLEMKWWERAGMMALGGLMVVVWLTIAWEKPHALLFAMSILGLGLVGRWAAHNQEKIGRWMVEPVGYPLAYAGASQSSVSIAIAEKERAAESHLPEMYKPKSRILTATRGNPGLMQFALEQAKNRQAELLVLFIRHIALPTLGHAQETSADYDSEAQQMFAQIKDQAAHAGVPIRCLYAVAEDVSDAILDIAVTHGVDTLLLGATQRGGLWRTMKGDVIQQVAQYLPESISLLIHS